MEDLKSRLEAEFKDDNIRKEITFSGLEDKLYNDEILSMHTEASFSTTDASRILGKPDSTIRNYFRTDLVTYIGPEKLESRYKLNYTSVFKLRMIFLLSDYAKKTTADLLSSLGLKASHVLKDPKKIQKADSDIQHSTQKEASFETKHMISYLVFQNTLLSKKDELKSIESDLQQYSYEISYLELQNEKITSQHRFEFLQNRQEQFLSLALKDSNKKGGFLQSFKQVFAKDEDPQKILLDSKELSIKLNNELNEKLEIELKANKDEIEKIKEKKRETLQLIEEKKKEILTLETKAKQELGLTQIESGQE